MIVYFCMFVNANRATTNKPQMGPSDTSYSSFFCLNLRINTGAKWCNKFYTRNNKKSRIELKWKTKLIVFRKICRNNILLPVEIPTTDQKVINSEATNPVYFMSKIVTRKKLVTDLIIDYLEIFVLNLKKNLLFEERELCIHKQLKNLRS